MTTDSHEELPANLRERVRSWADNVAADSSPLYRRLGHAAADNELAMELVAAAPPNVPATTLFFAAVHAALLRESDHELARWFPTVSGQSVPDEDPSPAFAAFVGERTAELRKLITTRSLQTNEVGRCSLWLPALHLVAAEVHGSLALIELGCSAGLNLRFDDYRYEYERPDGGTVVAGRLDSDVALHCHLLDRTPLFAATVTVTHRVGLDVSPLGITEPDDMAWIRALVWPDQPLRHARLSAALRRAVSDPPPIIEGDALVDLAPTATALPENVTVCVVHTHLLNQLSQEQRAELDEVFTTLSEDRPIYRIANEWIHTPTPLLELTRYVDGRPDTQLLGRADKHGEWLEWVADG